MFKQRFTNDWRVKTVGISVLAVHLIDEASFMEIQMNSSSVVIVNINLSHISLIFLLNLSIS